MNNKRIGKKSKVESRKSKFSSLMSNVCSLRSSVFSLQSSVSPPRAAFTLMELLVVLAVIGLLIGLLLPALMGARERAKITRARSEVQTLQQAWLAYWNTYGRWPDVTEMDAEAVAILAGVDETDNPYKIAFMEFDDRHLTEGFKDPWLDNFYRIVLTAEEGTPDTEVEWAFTTRAHLINTARYRY